MLYRTRTIHLISLAMAFVATPAGLLAGQMITFPAGDFPGGQTTPVPNGYGSTTGVATTFRSLEAFGNTAEIGGMRWWDSGHGSLNGVAYDVNRNASVAEVGLMSTGGGGASVVPEPSSVVLLATGLVGLAIVGRRARRRRGTQVSAATPS